MALPRSITRAHSAEPSCTDSLYTFVMTPRLRSAVMCLLLLALPLQGFAAATMLHCGPNHQRTLTAATAETHEQHEHAAAEQHHHESGLADAQHQVAPVDGSSDTVSLSHLDKLMKFKCNACAVCCIGAVLPTATYSFEPFPPAMAPESFVLTSHAGFVTDGPDRPPRLSHV